MRSLLLFALLAGLAHGQTTTRLVALPQIDCHGKPIGKCPDGDSCMCTPGTEMDAPKAKVEGETMPATIGSSGAYVPVIAWKWQEASKAKVDAIPAQQPKEFVWILGAASDGNYEATKKACDMARERYGTDTEMRTDGCYVKIFTEPPPKQEAMDEPAVLKTTTKDCCWCRDYLQAEKCPPLVKLKTKRWTCADKNRVLLKDEAGGNHCILFPKQ